MVQGMCYQAQELVGGYLLLGALGDWCKLRNSIKSYGLQVIGQCSICSVRHNRGLGLDSAQITNKNGSSKTCLRRISPLPPGFVHPPRTTGQETSGLDLDPSLYRYTLQL